MIANEALTITFEITFNSKTSNLNYWSFPILLTRDVIAPSVKFHVQVNIAFSALYERFFYDIK